MALFCSIKPKALYKEWFTALLQYAILKNATAISLEIVNDTFIPGSTKSLTRQRRGNKARLIHLNGPGQKLPQGKQWEDFFKNEDNKID